ncbi:MAG: hypothetical protein LIP77_02305 [Planctomycetes bacterium]|nr:hypothetical protein [Planctomycetota bacterium]
MRKHWQLGAALAVVLLTGAAAPALDLFSLEDFEVVMRDMEGRSAGELLEQALRYKGDGTEGSAFAAMFVLREIVRRFPGDPHAAVAQGYLAQLYAAFGYRDLRPARPPGGDAESLRRQFDSLRRRHRQKGVRTTGFVHC